MSTRRHAVRAVLRKPWAWLAALAALATVSGVGAYLASGSAQSADGCGEGSYPFVSIPCEVYQSGPARAATAEPGVADVALREPEVMEKYRALNPDAEVVEARLIYAWSAQSDKPEADRQLLWAIVARPVGGIMISSGSFYMQEATKLRQPGDTRPLTAEELSTVQQAVEKRVAAERAALTKQFEIDFLDPYTGEYLGARQLAW